MSRLWPLTLRGTGALVIALVCLILARELGLVELTYFAVLLLAALVASLISLYATYRAETVTRTVAGEVAAVGRRSTILVRVAVRTAVPTPQGEWFDVLPAALKGDPRGSFPALGSSLRGGADRFVELTYEVVGVRRGIHSIGPLRLSSSDPFGLTRRRLVIGGRTRITVVPALIELPPMSSIAGEAGGVIHSSVTQLGQGVDNLIARPYSSGDSMRRIHWRATAHRDELMVRQEEQESTPEATVVFDRASLRWSAEAMRAPGADAAFEAGVSACVSAAARLVNEGYVVEVIDSDGTPLVGTFGGADSQEIEHMLVHFATLTASQDDQLGRLPALFLGATTGPIVLVIGRVDAAAAATIAPIAHHSTLPLLLAVAPVAGALDSAEAAGWRTSAIPPGTDLAAAWAGAISRGVHSVIG